MIKAGDFSGKSGATLVMHIPGASGKRVILLGTEGADTAQQQIKAIEAGAAALLKTPSTKAVWVGEGLADDNEWQAVDSRTQRSNSELPVRSSAQGQCKNQTQKIKDPNLLGTY